MGNLIDRSHRELKNQEIETISKTYHLWRDKKKYNSYRDIKGFCKSVTTKEIALNNHVLTPGLYVGIEDIKDDDYKSFEEKIKNLIQEYSKLSNESKKLDSQIRRNWKEMGFEI